MLDQLGEDALVGGQVLHQHKGHAVLPSGRHGGKESLERRQPPGRGAYAHDPGKPAAVDRASPASGAGTACTVTAFFFGGFLPGGVPDFSFTKLFFLSCQVFLPSLTFRAHVSNTGTIPFGLVRNNHIRFPAAGSGTRCTVMMCIHYCKSILFF